MDTYQPIYDAARQALSGISHQIAEAARSQFDISFAVESVRQSLLEVAIQHQRPCFMLRAKLFLDGDHWCALYGEDLQSGLAGFGKSPADAMGAFDAAFYKKQP